MVIRGEKMKMLLCSEFAGVGYKFLNRFFDSGKGKTCLFVGYAREDYKNAESSSLSRIKDFGFDVVVLDENFDFSQKIDMIFVRGGNTTALIDKLREFKQYEKLKDLVKNGVVYVGNSAGTILAGTETAWTLWSEPYEVDLTQKFGKNALDGFGLVNKIFLVHTGRFRLNYEEEASFPGEVFRTKNTEFYGSYLRERKRLKGKNIETIKNNEVIFIDGNIYKKLVYDWSKIPVKN